MDDPSTRFLPTKIVIFHVPDPIFLQKPGFWTTSRAIFPPQKRVFTTINFQCQPSRFHRNLHKNEEMSKNIPSVENIFSHPKSHFFGSGPEKNLKYRKKKFLGSKKKIFLFLRPHLSGWFQLFLLGKKVNRTMV